MLRTLSYFNIFFPVIYFITYFRDAQDYVLTVELIVLIIFSGLILKQEESSASGQGWLIRIFALLTLGVLVARLIPFYRLMVLVDFEYTDFRMDSFIVLSVIFFTAIGWQLGLWYRRIRAGGY